MLQGYIDAISTDVLSLPDNWRARSGYQFCPSDEFWSIPDSSSRLSFDFPSLLERCTNDIIHSCKKTLLWYLQNRSPVHAENMFSRFKHFVLSRDGDTETLSSVSSQHILNYRGFLPKEKEWYLGSLSGFLKKWHELGYPGIGADAYALLRSLTIEGNRKGWAVLTMDPEKGPFTNIELTVLHQSVNNTFSRGEIGNRQFSLVWLFMATGARSIQIADLKIKDFLPQRLSDGVSEYLIQMPRAKQRNALRRSAFKPRPLVREVGEVLEAWIAQIKEEAASQSIENLRADDLPIFPTWYKLNPPGFEHHSDSQGLGHELRMIFSKLNVTSHRTGEPIKITPRRFRYTLGTRAAQEKLGPLVIAEMLDHDDTQNVMVYTKATPEIIETIDEALAMELAPLAQAFAGKIVAADDETDRADDPTSLVRRPGGTPGQDGVGRCGRCGTCGAAAPIACYTCGNFQAWLDAPHEEVLRDLLDERNRLLGVTGDERIAHVNDNVILAVAQVVEECKRIKAGQGRVR